MSIKQLTPDERRERLIAKAKWWRAKMLSCETFEGARSICEGALAAIINESDKLFSVGGGYYDNSPSRDEAEEIKKCHFATKAETDSRNIIYNARELAEGILS